MEQYKIYDDISKRTDGEIYIGVVGPVRTGKSTFIKRFMDLYVLPNLSGEQEALRLRDELPQSSGGKTITTTEPKFIPQQAADICLGEGVHFRIRMVDCVGYMVNGAVGHMEDGEERLVKTPWFAEGIPFSKAAEIGTSKVIEDHSTIGIAVTTDGSFGELAREEYIEAEERTVNALKDERKPFILLLNSSRPYSEETRKLAEDLEVKYDVNVLPMNCDQLKKEDVHHILETILLEFPVTGVEFYIPKWVEILPMNHPMKENLIQNMMKKISNSGMMKHVNMPMEFEGDYVRDVKIDSIDMSTGMVKIIVSIKEEYYYQMLSELTGENLDNEYELMEYLKEVAQVSQEYNKVNVAMDQVKNTGYGVVLPVQEEVKLLSPELIKHGNKYGVKIKANSSSIHFIRAGVETEIAPIVGTKEQAEDLITYIKEADNREESVWDTNIFGKTVNQLVQEGIQNKVNMIGEDTQMKLQESMQKIVNDMNGGMVCIII